jgi:hypothetical protein
LPDAATELTVHLHAIDKRIHFIEISIHSFMKRSALCGKIAQIPGVGPITAAAIVAAVGDARQVMQRPVSDCLVGPRAAAVFFLRQVAPVSHQPAR